MNLYALYQEGSITNYVYASTPREALQIYQERQPSTVPLPHPVLWRQDKPTGKVWNRSIATDQEMEVGVMFWE